MDTKERILQGAILASEQVGYMKVTRADVAHRAGVSESVVQYHFRNKELEGAILETAIKNENLTVLGQAMGMRDWRALSLDAPLRYRVLSELEELCKEEIFKGCLP